MDPETKTLDLWRRQRMRSTHDDYFGWRSCRSVLHLNWPRLLSEFREKSSPVPVPVPISLAQAPSPDTWGDIPWFRAPTGRPPAGAYFSKKLYDAILNIVLDHLDLLDQLRLALVSKRHRKVWRHHLARKRRPVNGAGLAKLYKCECRYSLCVSFANNQNLCVHGEYQMPELVESFHA